MPQSAPQLRPDGALPDESFAVEALRQAQKLVEAQITANAAIGSKLTSVMQAAIGLASASLAGAAAALGATDTPGWLPTGAGVGLFITGIGWSVAGGLAALGLRSPELVAPAIRPSRLREAKLDRIAASQAFMAIAWELEDAFLKNRDVARRTAGRLEYAIGPLLVSPLVGIGVILARAPGPERWLVPPAIVLALGLLGRRFFLRRRHEFVAPPESDHNGARDQNSTSRQVRVRGAASLRALLRRHRALFWRHDRGLVLDHGRYASPLRATPTWRR